MNPAPHNISAMTDISANIFALLVFILIVMIAARDRAPAIRADAPQLVNIEKDIAAVERLSLGSDGLFDLLYDRSAGTASAKIDLFERGIDVVFGGETERFNSVESVVPRLRQIAAATGSPVGVYVFGHHFYRSMTDTLKRSGLQWREVSVPQALRDIGKERSGQGWSGGFSQLIAHPADRARFRVELARLLQSSSTDENPGQSWLQGAASSRPQETTIDTLMRWSRIASNAIALFGGLVFVSWVETRR